MTEPIRVESDAANAIKDFYLAELDGLVDGPYTVSNGVPRDWTPDSPAHVGVFNDGGPGQWPVFDNPRIRVTVWAAGRTRARRIAAIARGMVSVRRVPGVARIDDPSSIIDARDPHNAGIMASFHVGAVARTVAL